MIENEKKSSDDEIDDQTQTWKQYGSNKHSDRVARDRRKRLQKIEDPLTLMSIEKKKTSFSFQCFELCR